MTLTNFEIEQILNSYNIIKNYKGCFYKNKLPDDLTDGYYFLNLDNSNSNKGGTHWTLLVISPNTMPIYFDSFGLPAPELVANQLKKLPPHKKYIFSNEIIQDLDTTTCGWYCIALMKYLERNKHKSKDITLLVQQFIDTFKDDTKKNNQVLKKKHFNHFSSFPY
jgi:hypothetical protein